MAVTVSKLSEPKTIRRHNFKYQGAIVRSKLPGKPGWYFETRMKANATAMSSTFWLMTNNKSKKKLELDIQECVGTTSDKTADWAKKWDEIFHSNLIRRRTATKPRVQIQGQLKTETKNHERYYVYAAWWKSPHEVRFYLDGKFAYKLEPETAWDVPAFLQMAIETYDWNPVPKDGGKVVSGTWEERTTQYDWVRVWKLD